MNHINSRIQMIKTRKDLPQMVCSAVQIDQTPEMKKIIIIAKTTTMAMLGTISLLSFLFYQLLLLQ
jgi:hypothetical protein